ncbi:hypothetical protein H4R22_002816 [Coemansia sp. RSA 1290]|nr:hypothetical protein H4R22_002816 [Coemansia sp. RSA 1290]
MNAPGEREPAVSIEGLRSAFAVGTPTAVYTSLVPFLRQESKSTGDTQVINEISQSISQLVGGWLQTSQTMAQHEQHTLYRLLRPSGRLVDRLLQYHLMQRHQGHKAELRIPLHVLPAEFQVPSMELARATRLPAEFVRRKSPTGFAVDAVEHLVFYVMRALGTVEGSQVAQWLGREYVGGLLPVAVPDRPSAGGAEKADRSPIKQIRERLHDLGPAREEPDMQRALDLLDVCEFEQAAELAGFVAASAAVLWLPAVPPSVLASIRNGSSDGWLWTPRASQLPGLRLFFLVVSHMARGERQLERHHLSGSSENGRRVEMNGTLRDMLRSQCFNAAVCDMLGLALLGAADAELWVPALDLAVSIWLRYALPWRSSAEPAPAMRGEISAIWQSRVPLMLKGMSASLYGPALSLFLRRTSAPQVDLLAHTHLGRARKPGHGVQTWIHDAVSSVFGHPSLDVLTVIGRVLGAFAASELAAILEAIERSRLDARRTVGPAEPLAQLTPTRQPAEQPDGRAFELQVAAAQRLVAPYRETARSGSPLLDYALSRPPKHMAFGPTRPLLLADCVRALHGAEVLAERQLRLLAPESSADQARSLVADIFLVLGRLFSASDGGGAWNGALGGSRESARLRVQGLHEAQASIRGLYGKLQVLGTRREIEAIKQAQDDAAISAQGGLQPLGASGGFGQRLAARNRPTDVATPEMRRGALTPRGRWELKTGRKKFTTQSLLPSPQRPVWAGGVMPRGERARLQARSYESQWLLDRIRLFNVWANRHFQALLNLVDEHAFPVPSQVRAYQLDFRWAAAYPNIRFAFLVLAVLRLLLWIF